MYMASELDKSWLLNVQKKLYAQSWKEPGYVFRELWGLVTDSRNLRIALARVARNKGRRTSGVDGQTVRALLSSEGADAFLAELRASLRNGAYAPSPARRVLIPKNGQPGKFRPLGIPTVTDRVVQAALKNIMEPIFEADFYPASYGFRPGKSAHGALEQLRLLLRPRGSKSGVGRRFPYQWAVEGDIKGCFDNIDQHALMVRVRRRIGDNKVSRLVLAFLKSGVLSEKQFIRTESGTPQGGILSPLLANIALAAIEERYERYAWPRCRPTTLTNPTAIGQRANNARAFDKRRARCVCMPVRYADDFIILVSAASECKAEAAAQKEKAALAESLRNELSLELSEAKTLVTPVTKPLRFLGHHVRVRAHPSTGKVVSTAVIPKDRGHRLRERIKALFKRSTTQGTLESRLKFLNPILRGWCNFYRHAWGAKRVFARLDCYVWWTVFRWLQKKHPTRGVKWLIAHYDRPKPGGRSVRWHDGETRVFVMSSTPVRPFRLAWEKSPSFAMADGEPGAQRKVPAGFGEGRPETDPV
jgi:group II intron reverse transcriptase/maturase